MESNALIVADEREGLPSASSMDRVMNCPGSRNLEAQCAPEEEEKNEDAESGTEIHKALELRQPEQLTGEQRRVYDMCVDLESRAMLSRPFTSEHRENRMWFILRGQKVFSGKADVVLIDAEDKRGYVIDYKTGNVGAGIAATNWQLHSLAVLVNQNYPLLSEIECIVIQPLAFPQTSSTVYGFNELSQAETRILSAISASLKPDARRIPGDHCKWCLAKADCPETRAYANAIVRKLESPAKIDSLWLKLSPIQKAEMWDMCERVEEIAEAIKKKIKADLAENPFGIPGLVKKKDQQARSVADLPALFEALKNHIPEIPEETLKDKLLAECGIGIGDLEKLVVRLKNCQRVRAEEWVNTLGKTIIKTTTKSGSISKEKA